MKSLSQDWLAELNLSPLWRERTSVAQAPSPAINEQNHLLQGIHQRGYLPHLKAEGAVYSVTFRLADSLPASVLDRIEQFPADQRSQEIETYLNAGHGEAWLARPPLAEMFVEVLRKREGEQYRLHSWVVMPNHVHLVIEPLAGHALSEILQAIKSTSAHRANQILQRSGEFWQRESYDHLVRDDEDLARCNDYVYMNPVRAGLAAAPESYAYSSVSMAGEGACATVLDVAHMDWPRLKQTVATCTLCPLHGKRTQAVFGVGDEQADWLFVGEGPGADEDIKGEPFVGQAGKLLDNMLASISLRRGEKVYIANVVKCRPPGNRNPEPAEALACAPFLDRQIELIAPKLIVALGKVAAVRLLGRDASIASLRGQVLNYHGRPLIVTYHPAYLLRSLVDKAKAWEDLCFIKRTMQALQTARLAPI